MHVPLEHLQALRVCTHTPDARTDSLRVPSSLHILHVRGLVILNL